MTSYSRSVVPKKMFCDAGSREHFVDNLIPVCQVLGHDAGTLLETLLVPVESLGVATLRHCVLPNSAESWGANKIGHVAHSCTQSFFFDTRSGSAGLLATAQRAMCADHSSKRQSEMYFTQLVDGRSATLCVCHMARCSGTRRLAREQHALVNDSTGGCHVLLTGANPSVPIRPLNACPISGAEFDDASLISDRLFLQRHAPAPIGGVAPDAAARLVSLAIDREWRFFYSSTGAPILGTTAAVPPPPPLTSEPLTESETEYRHGTTLCALDLREKTLTLSNEMVAALAHGSSLGALNQLIGATLSSRGSEREQHKRGSCCCLIEYRRKQAAQQLNWVALKAIPLPLARVYNRLGDSVRSIESPSMREIFTKQVAAQLAGRETGAGVTRASDSAWYDIDQMAPRDSKWHFEAVLARTPRLCSLVGLELGAFTTTRQASDGAIVFRPWQTQETAHYSRFVAQKSASPRSGRPGPAPKWLLDHNEALRIVCGAFGQPLSRFGTLGELAIHLGYLRSDGAFPQLDSGDLTLDWLPPLAAHCLARATTRQRLLRGIGSKFVPFGTVCETTLLAELYQTPNRRIAMARIVACFFTRGANQTFDAASYEKASLYTLCTLAMLAMVDDVASGAITLQSYMSRETGFDFFNVNQWWQQQQQHDLAPLPARSLVATVKAH